MTTGVESLASEPSFFYSPQTFFKKQFSSFDLTINSIAGYLIAGGGVLGSTYTFTHSNPSNPSVLDFEGGACIALSSAIIISSVTAAIQSIRGNKQDARMWLAGIVGLGALGLKLSSVPQLSETNLDVSINEHGNIPKNFEYLQNCATTTTNEHNAYRISCHNYEIGKNLISNLEENKKINMGSRPTYIYREEAVVIQQDSWTRVHKMEEVLKLCEKNGYKHLNIARASVYQNFIIQDLLPIDVWGFQKEQMGYYFNNQEAFTSAIKEFTNFLCHVYHTDLNSITGKTPFQDFSDGSQARFDNAALYIEDGVGKIAIPDLDSCYVTFPSEPHFEDAIRFFPFHYNHIIAEAKKYYPSLDYNDPKLLEIRNNALQMYDNAYVKHVRSIEKQNITFDSSDHFPAINEQLIKQIEDAALENGYQKIITSPSFEALKLLEKDNILDLARTALKDTNAVLSIRDKISQLLREKKLESREVNTMDRLLESRSVYMHLSEPSNIPRILKFRLMFLAEGAFNDRVCIGKLYTTAILDEFVKHGLISSHRLEAGTGYYTIFA